MLDIITIEEQIAQVVSNKEDVVFLANFFKKTNFSKPETVLTVLSIKAKDDNFSWVSKEETKMRVINLLNQISERKNSSSKFDLKKLDAIPIDDVLKSFHVEFNGKDFLCPHEHKKPQKLSIYTDRNICKCHNCSEVKGGPVSVATWLLDGDFVSACKHLAELAGIDEVDYKPTQTSVPYVAKPIEYLSFDKSQGFKHIEVDDYIERYSTLEPKQRLKLVYTFIYRFSLKTKRDSLMKYYDTRGVRNNIHVDKIGYLSDSDITALTKELNNKFPLEDLNAFGVLNDAKHKYYPSKWKQLKNTLLVPSFDIYTDLVEGFMLRPVDESNKWFKGKEKKMSIQSIQKPLPFGIGYRVLSKDCDVYITEGHIDAFSLPEGSCFVATPGVNSFEEEQLGLLKGRNIKLVFDQDESGLKVAYGYNEVFFLEKSIVVLDTMKDELEGMLKILKSQDIKYTCKHTVGLSDKLVRAGVNSVEVVSWDKSLGNDINDLVANGNLSKIESLK